MKKAPKLSERQGSFIGYDEVTSIYNDSASTTTTASSLILASPITGNGSTIEDKEVSDGEVIGEVVEEKEHVDFIGSLPNFLVKKSSTISLASLAPPPIPLSIQLTNISVPVPSFTLDCATPSPVEEIPPSPAPAPEAATIPMEVEVVEVEEEPFVVILASPTIKCKPALPLISTDVPLLTGIRQA